MARGANDPALRRISHVPEFGDDRKITLDTPGSP